MIKQLKAILVGLVIGILVGMALGVNIGREKPLLSNPFSKDTLIDKAKRLGSETVEESGRALEKAGQALQDKAK
ncbi:MAG: hypothetical protein KJ795_00355 [Gammaproteobacteria bacterium]|nr:hypothetical protein [Gammaproteobacteria bacterium]MBU1777861.1 hypothetical protein [Gammaproteobacteria bacterium]